MAAPTNPPSPAEAGQPDPNAPAAETPMIERAARALCRAMAEDERGWRYLQGEARAVIEALHEPDDTIVAAAKRALEKPRQHVGHVASDRIRGALTAYDAMIAAALGET